MCTNVSYLKLIRPRLDPSHHKVAMSHQYLFSVRTTLSWQKVGMYNLYFVHTLGTEALVAEEGGIGSILLNLLVCVARLTAYTRHTCRRLTWRKRPDLACLIGSCKAWSS